MIDTGESREQAAAEVTSCLLGKTNRQRGEKQSGGIGEVVVAVGRGGRGQNQELGSCPTNHIKQQESQRLQPR